MDLNTGKTIALVGSAIVDCMIMGFDPKPVSAAGFVAESVSLKPGGEAVNQAVTLAKLGLRPRAVCFLGNDDASRILSGELEKYHVDLSYVVRPEGQRTPVTVMFVDEDGDRKSITNHTHWYNFHPEADMRWMDGCSAISLCSLFRTPFNDPEVVFQVVSEAKRRGLRVYADTKLPNANKLSLEDLRDSLPLIDVITPNESEAAYYSGKNDPEDMADGFLRFGVKTVIVKLGGNGCLLKNAEETIRLPGLPVNAIDATGAGDNFGAGFLTMKEEGLSDEEALRFANACGAIASTKVGATAGIESRGQVLDFLYSFTAQSRT